MSNLRRSLMRTLSTISSKSHECSINESVTAKAQSPADDPPEEAEPAEGSIDSSISNNAVEPPRPIADPADILSQSLSLTDLVFGIYAIELWRYDEATGKLFNVDINGGHDEETGRSGGGLLLRRRTQESDPDNDHPKHREALDAFERLTDSGRRDFLPPSPVDPGVGVPGVLWAEQGASALHATLGGMTGVTDRLMTMHRHGRGSSAHVGGGGDGILWRDVGQLADDPDQPYDERLQTFAKAGFKLAAGVPFDTNGYQGMVIYFGNPHAEKEKLRHPANSKFMSNAAQLIGCAAAIQGITEEVKQFREEVADGNWKRLKTKLMMMVRIGGSLGNAAKAKEEADRTSRPGINNQSLSQRLLQTSYRFKLTTKEVLCRAKDRLKSRLSRWTKKIRGGSAGIPPRFSYRQCLWTFVGVTTTLTALSRINLWIESESDRRLHLILAPMGSLTTLQYNLSAAPASQPRNTIFAQTFAFAVAITLGYIPNVEPWVQSVLAPAIVIPGMARLGIIHPPAASMSILFASGEVGWEHFGIFISAVIFSIFVAVCINNMSDKRQYPTSWYLLHKAKNLLVK